ncbi:zinc ABC transporter substrate-binding protein [Cochlodiniinecator piscidefendens]|uniref:zinc ABC transporter substrate-binding protein n=1 Tax=Cochlodiniinecator piscidefendens TaxID=2715756 RepID=UPI0014098C26|nr:zinc ABC transporter substrate-binding protein [Cochlodiniinecator piscidefendens]
MTLRNFVFPLFCGLPAAFPAAAQVPHVVTDIAPIHSLVSQVMGDLGTPELLLDQGADPHSFQLRPSQAQDLQSADLIVWVGPALTPWLDQAIDRIGTGEHFALLGDAHEEEHSETEDHHDEGHHDEEDGHDEHAEGHNDEHSDHEDEDHHEAADAGGHHHHDGEDPHAWLDPAEAVEWLPLIADRISALDPANSATYTQNAETAVAELNQLILDIGQFPDTPIIVQHDAFGHFADRFGVHIAGAVAEGDAARPGAAHIAELQALIAAENITCAFAEPQHDPSLLETVFEGQPVTIGTLDPTGALIPAGPELYTTLIRNIADTIQTCTAQN